MYISAHMESRAGFHHFAPRSLSTAEFGFKKASGPLSDGGTEQQSEVSQDHRPLLSPGQKEGSISAGELCRRLGLTK
jgi:hypothetical protein